MTSFAMAASSLNVGSICPLAGVGTPRILGLHALPPVHRGNRLEDFLWLDLRTLRGNRN
jgi:hypothetical protein